MHDQFSAIVTVARIVDEPVCFATLAGRFYLIAIYTTACQVHGLVCSMSTLSTGKCSYAV